MCNWDSDHLGDVFQYIRDPTPHDDNDAHFAWRKRWVEAYIEAQWWIKIGSRYHRKEMRLQKELDFKRKAERKIFQGKVAELLEENTQAKELIENIIRVTWGEGWNYSLDWKIKAEQFLKEAEK